MNQSNTRKAYARLVGMCETANQRARLHIELENYAPFKQWIHIFQEISEEHGKLRTRLAKVTLFRFLSGKFAKRSRFYKVVASIPYVLKFTRRHQMNNRKKSDFIHLRKTKSYSHFVHPDNEKQNLLIVWTGSLRRPMMPLAIYLESVRKLRCDVLVLRPKPSLGYKEGVKGFGETTPEAIQGISEFIELEGYINVYCHGTSLGTLPALESVNISKIRSILVSGPVNPTKIDPEWLESYKSRLGPIGKLPKIVLVTGTRAERDIEAGQFLSSLIPLENIEVKGASHNPIWERVKKNQFGGWLATTLEIDLPQT